MSKMTNFYAKVMGDASLKAEYEAALGGRNILSATDEELMKIGDIAKKAGFDITVQEAKAFLDPEEVVLDTDDLDAVAGGDKYDDFLRIQQEELDEINTLIPHVDY